jgi:hypothetical protein
MLLMIKKFHVPICLILFIIYQFFWLGLKSEALFIIIKHSISFWIQFQLDIYRVSLVTGYFANTRRSICLCGNYIYYLLSLSICFPKTNKDTRLI